MPSYICTNGPWKIDNMECKNVFRSAKCIAPILKHINNCQEMALSVFFIDLQRFVKQRKISYETLSLHLLQNNVIKHSNLELTINGDIDIEGVTV